jgi:hypothetical protein
MDERFSPREIDTRLVTLRAAHRALDNHINQLAADGEANQLDVQRLKRQKLALKDRISYLERHRIPDIIA